MTERAIDRHLHRSRSTRSGERSHRPIRSGPGRLDLPTVKGEQALPLLSRDGRATLVASIASFTLTRSRSGPTVRPDSQSEKCPCEHEISPRDVEIDAAPGEILLLRLAVLDRAENELFSTRRRYAREAPRLAVRRPGRAVGSQTAPAGGLVRASGRRAGVPVSAELRRPGSAHGPARWVAGGERLVRRLVDLSSSSGSGLSSGLSMAMPPAFEVLDSTSPR